MVLDLADLDDLEPAALRRLVGGKAASLVCLQAMGLPVPPARIVPVAALEAHLKGHGLWARSRAGEDLSAELLQLPLLPALSRELRRKASGLGPLLAVRSSALDEDEADASFAGQYHSSLGVPPGAALEDAIRRCWASAWSGSASAYRRSRSKAGIAAAPMAVVIQRLVLPRCAGVLFTIDPASGSWREMTVEAAWGQGEAVVGGHVVPEFHRVRRPRRTPRPVQRVLARVRLEPMETRLGSQHEQWELAEGRVGLVARPLPQSRIDALCLPVAELLRLCRLGLRVEGRMGGPVDLEWALDEAGTLWVLQARPVTTSRDVRRSGPVLWTRRFVGERWTRPATPLGWSLVRDVLDWFIAYPQTSRRYLGGGAPSRLVRFAPYFNVTVFRHLAFKLPGAPPPRFMVELLPPREESGWRLRRAHPPDLRVYASIIGSTLRERRWQRFRWNLLTNWRAWEELVPRLDHALAELAGPIDRRAEALARDRSCEGLLREYVKVHICSLLFANIWYQVAEGMLAADGQAELAPALLRAPEDSLTARMNQDLWRLGRGQLELETFLERYGHRADGSWELFVPRWREDPAAALSLAEAIARGPDPAVAAARSQALAQEAIARVRGPTRAVVDLARRYLALREDQRAWFDRIAWEWKRCWLWLESSTGLDVRFLEAAEARAHFDGDLGREEALVLIDRRRAAHEEEGRRREAGDEPPVFLVGEEAVLAHSGDLQRLQGMGISAGMATGPVRVVRTLADAHKLRPGDILVTRTTDPAWTSLFVHAGGLVMELGGMLSHGAVVAREYALPAIVNVPEATQRLHDGQTVTVDGSRGILWIR